jgi:predicted metal-binding protein
MTATDLDHWCERAVELGADAATAIAPQNIVTAAWVRMKCLYGCGGGDECRNCPPRSPTPIETRAVLDEFKRAVLLRLGPLTDSDYDESHAQRLRTAALALERELFLAGHYKAWSMLCGPCELCETCVMDGPCVHPEEARPSMEACGIDVFATVRNAGWEIDVVRDKNEPYRRFAVVLVD